jgi:putative flippase GtrA
MRQAISKLTEESFSRYVLAGAGAFVIEYGSFYLMYVRLKGPLYLANSISFGLGLLTSFLLNRLWTFGHKSYSKRTAHQLSFYITLALVNLLLTNVLVGLLKQVEVNPRIGKLIAMIVTSLWNYVLFKAIIFTHRKNESGEKP